LSEPRLSLDIERLASSGEGVAHDPDGRVVFVPATVPGDRVEVRLVEERRRFARGEVSQRVEDGPDRVEPRCTLVGRCGGCTWQHIAYPAQVRAKGAIVEDALRRIGRLDLPGEVVCTPSPDPFGYRGRARLGFEGGRVGFRHLRSHALCPTTTCAVLAPPLAEALAALGRKPPEGQGELTLAAGDDGAVCITGDGRPGRGVVLEVAGDRVRVSAGGFLQVNALLRGALAEAVFEAAGSGERLAEYFAGAGFFTLGLARRFGRVVAVESHPTATADLAANLTAAGLSNVEVETARAESDRHWDTMRRFAPQVVVLDPPRTGLPPRFARYVAGLGADRIVYVSCDPATLARDLRVLCDDGYRLTSIRGFDLFPQTPHVETLATLERGAS
jgi:23S rRNA (uracil1939-C5)-methyltransferase